MLVVKLESMDIYSSIIYLPWNSEKGSVCLFLFNIFLFILQQFVHVKDIFFFTSTTHHSLFSPIHLYEPLFLLMSSPPTYMSVFLHGLLNLTKIVYIKQEGAIYWSMGYLVTAPLKNMILLPSALGANISSGNTKPHQPLSSVMEC